MCFRLRKTDNIAILLVLLWFLFTISTSVCAAPNYTSCDESPSNYTSNSPFGNNLNEVLESLSTNSASKDGFHNTSFGNGTDKVYGRTLCRGDVTSEVCQNCVKAASQEIMMDCHTESAIIWHELCQVEYSYRMFFSSMVYTGKFPKSNDQEKEVSDPDQFLKSLKDLMYKISDEAAFRTKLMFSTGVTKLSNNETIYGLVQCTRDISSSECKGCLVSAFGDIDEGCHSKQGGTVFSRTCNMRFQLDRFYNEIADTGRRRKTSKKIWMVAPVSCAFAFVLASLVSCFVIQCKRSRGTQEDEERSQNALIHELGTITDVAINEEEEPVSSQELPFMELGSVKAATNNFSDFNKLGQGGFGTVYKGVFANGKEIAVKRLSRRPWQGLEQFRNEVILITRLQHRNLVRLVGCGIEGEEKLLVYEYMPNKSLDLFIFDSENRAELHWNIRLNIIQGIARGLLYLHEDSRQRIIHRDLKPSNILLDHDMVAKISDFGIARIFGESQNTANTRRVAGTYGYMAPEYAMQGLFSVKSDVFSFGVVLLEIISGERNFGFYLTEHAPTLLAYAWRLWNEGKELEFVDPSVRSSCPIEEVAKHIHIALLCVQHDPDDRPTMSTVVVMLLSESTKLPEPNPPTKYVSRVAQIQPSSSVDDASVNQVTVSSTLTG